MAYTTTKTRRISHMDTITHVLPGMQAEAATTFADLVFGRE